MRIIEEAASLNEDLQKIKWNILLFDKIGRYHKVFEIYNHLQTREILESMHEFFKETEDANLIEALAKDFENLIF